MQHVLLDRAMTSVADTTEMSGRVTAKWIRQSGLMRIGALTVLGLSILLIPVPARAQAPPASIPAEIAALKAQVAALQAQVAALQSSNSGLGAQVAAIQANHALALGPFVSVDSNPQNGVIGPNITFTGANIHIVSGSGATDDSLAAGGSLTGRGNLIIGYDELLPGQVANRGGSHNLVIGRFHAFTSLAFSGLVAGENNTISAGAASVSGGFFSTASGQFASVSGGVANTASANLASVSGGVRNTASGIGAVVIGGADNTASSPLSIAP